MKKSTFSTTASEALGYYVYLLIDPRNEKIFYIGKGLNSRCFEHIQEALEAKKQSDKCEHILDIINSGNEVKISILRHGLKENEALLVESCAIDLLKDSLKNEVSGHNSSELGLMSIQEIETLYSAVPLTQVDDPIILININKMFKRNMSADDIYEVTRKSWKVDLSKAKKVKYAIATYRGISRGVFEIMSWNSSSDVEGRSEFTGKIAPEIILEKYNNKSVEKFLKKGSQNPIKYLLK